MGSCIYGVSAGGEGVTEGAQRAANAMIDAWLEEEGTGAVCARHRVWKERAVLHGQLRTGRCPCTLCAQAGHHAQCPLPHSPEPPPPPPLFPAPFSPRPGDAAARRFPNHGRIIVNQMSVLAGLPLSFLLLRGLPTRPGARKAHFKLV